jgi:hypothetical protein
MEVHTPILPRPLRSLSLSRLVRLLRSLGIHEIDVPAEYMDSDSSDDASKFIDAVTEGIRVAMVAKSPEKSSPKKLLSSPYPLSLDDREDSRPNTPTPAKEHTRHSSAQGPTIGPLGTYCSGCVPNRFSLDPTPALVELPVTTSPLENTTSTTTAVNSTRGYTHPEIPIGTCPSMNGTHQYIADSTPVAESDVQSPSELSGPTSPFFNTLRTTEVSSLETSVTTPSEPDYVVTEFGDVFHRPSATLLQMMADVIPSGHGPRPFSIPAHTQPTHALPFIDVRGNFSPLTGHLEAVSFPDKAYSGSALFDTGAELTCVVNTVIGLGEEVYGPILYAGRNLSPSFGL